MNLKLHFKKHASTRLEREKVYQNFPLLREARKREAVPNSEFSQKSSSNSSLYLNALLFTGGVLALVISQRDDHSVSCFRIFVFLNLTDLVSITISTEPVAVQVESSELRYIR